MKNLPSMVVLVVGVVVVVVVVVVVLVVVVTLPIIVMLNPPVLLVIISYIPAMSPRIMVTKVAMTVALLTIVVELMGDDGGECGEDGVTVVVGVGNFGLEVEDFSGADVPGET